MSAAGFGFPPIDSERIVLAAALWDPAALSAVLAGLTPEDLSLPSHGVILRAIARLSSDAEPVSQDTVLAELTARGDIERAGGLRCLDNLQAGVVIPPLKNLDFHLRNVRAFAWRRRVAARAERLSKTASNGATDEAIAELLKDLAEDRREDDGLRRRGLAPSSLEGILDPAAGKVEWLVEGLLPRDETTLLCATWKTAKTLCGYGLVIDAITGGAVWGRFKLARPLRVLVMQFEMPHREDLRRFRRLVLGKGLEPEAIVKAVKDGRLTFLSRPPLDLGTDADLQVFHSIVEEHRPDLVAVDSIVAAFPTSELNDNPTVRRVLSRAFNPLTSSGIAVLGLHHYNKDALRTGMGKKSKNDSKAAVLGAGQFGAALGRVYGLERIGAGDRDPETKAGAFKVRLSLLGGWEPGADEPTILAIEDTPDGLGTTVNAFEQENQRRDGDDLAGYEQAARNIRNRVRRLGRVPRKEAIAKAVEELNLSPRLVIMGLDHAEGLRWIRKVPCEGTKSNEKDLVPGECGGGL